MRACVRSGVRACVRACVHVKLRAVYVYMRLCIHTHGNARAQIISA